MKAVEQNALHFFPPRAPHSKTGQDRLGRAEPFEIQLARMVRFGLQQLVENLI